MNSKVNVEKKLLYEVSYIRPLVILLLVLLHAFEKIGNGGGNYREFQLPEIYEWLIDLIKGFRIETIAMVAGYVFAYQSIDLLRKYQFKDFALKKARRLLVPMLLFGVVYYVLFFSTTMDFSISNFVVTLLSGCGHLWFLPMLFWCFISIWVIDRYNLSSVILFVGLMILSVIPIPALPFGFGRLPHFLFYVYGGYILWKHHAKVQSSLMNTKGIIILWVSYLALVVAIHYLPDISSDFSLIQKIKILFSNNCIRLINALVGTLALYVTICKYTTRSDFKPSEYVIYSSKVCYGVYVYHQFIFVFLYFYTPLFDVVNVYVLPWIAFIITLIISLILTILSLKTKIGRNLIG